MGHNNSVIKERHSYLSIKEMSEWETEREIERERERERDWERKREIENSFRNMAEAWTEGERTIWDNQ